MLSPDVRYSPRFTAGERQLLSFRDRLRDFRRLMTESIAPEAETMIRRHKESGGRAFGHPWAPWAASTRMARLRKGNAARGVLDDSGKLYRSLFAALRSGRRLQIINGGVRLLLAPDDARERQKMFWHQRGTRFMPARQVVPEPLPRAFRATVRALARDFLLTGRVRGAGGRFVGASA